MKARARSSASSSRAASSLKRSADGVEERLFALLGEYGHEQVSFASDAESGYRGIIAVHDTTLGPSLGGTRFWHYANVLEAFRDVLRLSRAMTYKAAVAGLNLGGGKSVIIGDPSTPSREAIFRAHGRHIERLGGRYITAEDVGTSPADMVLMLAETRHVAGLPGRSGDPSPVTALGVYRGMKACAQHRWGSDTLAGKTVAVQGVGKVGYYLCQHLAREGAALIVSDVVEAKVQRVVTEMGAKAVAEDEIYGVQADIFAPCALGGAINDRTIGRLKAEIVAGGANNQLAEERHGDELEAKGITYGPDYVVNGGGLINVNAELAGWSALEAHRKVSEIYDTMLHLFAIAEEEHIPSYKAADRLAERRLAEARNRNK